MTDHFYITTTLPYVNADPHIGHTLEFLQGDAYARYFRRKLGKENVFFNVGMDEHGLKIYNKALEAGKTPQEYADHYASRWVEFCRLFGISYDSFYRTSSPEHHKAAQRFWEASNQAGDIYKKKYEGLYCVGHEAFITEKELVDGKCPDHGTEPITHSEENYFFRLSKYRDALLKYYEENPNVIRPRERLHELVNWTKSMEDISISRVKENLPWGVPVPGDDSQVMYVWFDALTNYVNAVGYGTDDKAFKKWWPGIQLFGTDNLRFQAAIWQAMLASAGLPFSKGLFNHGMILADDGTKMSKTKGNVISPFDQLEKFGVEAVRYYMLAGLPTYSDAAYKEDELIAKYNSELADNFGNLLSRVVHLASARKVDTNNPEAVSSEFKKQVDDHRQKAEEQWETFNIYNAASIANDLAVYGNKYIDTQKPWERDKSEAAVKETLSNLGYLLKTVIDLYGPIIPEAAERARTSLKTTEKVVLFEKF